jgi:hypothetical protein
MTSSLLPPPKNGAPLRSCALFSILALAFLGSAASCSVDARVVLNPSGMVSMGADLTMKPEARVAWGSLQELDPTLPADPLDPNLLKSGLGTGSNVTSDATGTHLRFTFDPRKFVPDLNDSSGWEITLDRAAVRRLAALTTWGKSSALDALIPAPDTKVTEADYRDLLSYLLGPDATAKTVIDASTVKLTIVAPRPITSAPGAEVSGSTAIYRWPLVKVLALETPIKIKLVY